MRLWRWWALSLLCVTALWTWATVNGLEALQQSRVAAIRASLPELQEKFRALETLPQAVLDSASSPPDLSKLQSELSPYYAVYRLSAAPAWITALADARPDSGLIRPLPPGAEAGRVFAPDPPDAPAQYVLVCRTFPDGTRLVASLDCAYVFGPWLERHLRRIDPGLFLGGSEFSLSTMFAHDRWPLPPLQLGLNHWAAISAYLGRQLGVAVVLALAMAAFAYNIQLAARSLKREWQAVHARKQFNALVSHELRTPLAAIQMYAELLQNQWVEDAEQARQYVSILRREAEHLSQLVENVLSLSAQESGQNRFHPAPVDVNELVRPLLPASQLDLPAGLPPARADRMALLLVVRNLVQNALKYGGDPGAVRLSTKAAEGGILIQVRDSGPGIPAAQRTRIFQPYDRLHGDPGGVGLGLALVKSFVEGQQGRVRVSDAPGGGALFSVWLPEAR